MEVLHQFGIEANLPRTSQDFDVASVYELMEQRRDLRNSLYQSLAAIPGEPRDVTRVILDGFRMALRAQDKAFRLEYSGNCDPVTARRMHDRAEVYTLLSMQLGSANIAALSPFKERRRRRQAEVSPSWLKRELIGRFDRGELNDLDSPYCRPAIDRFVEVSYGGLQQVEANSSVAAKIENLRKLLPDGKTTLGAAGVTFAGITLLTASPVAAAEVPRVENGSSLQYASFESPMALPGHEPTPEPTVSDELIAEEAAPATVVAAEEQPVIAPNVLPGHEATPEPKAPEAPAADAEGTTLELSQTPMAPNTLPGHQATPEPRPDIDYIDVPEYTLPEAPAPEPAPEKPKETFIPAVPKPEPEPPKAAEKPKEQEKSPEKTVEDRIVAGYSLDKFAGYDQCLGPWSNAATAAGSFCLKGCGPTTTAEVLHVLRGAGKTPGDLIEQVNQNGGFHDYGTSWATNMAVAGLYGIQSDSIQGDQINRRPPSYEKIKEVLEQGGLVVVAGDNVDPYVPTGQPGAHFMIIRAITDEGNFLLYNPYTRVEGTWNSDPSDLVNKTEYKPDHIINNSFGAMFFYK